jgi:hypothetical protein
MELLQIIHFLLLIALSLSTRRRSVAMRAAVTLYIFYNIAPAVSFTIDYFSLQIDHHPKDDQLLKMLVADIMLLVGCGIAGGIQDAAQSANNDSPIFAGSLAVIALIATGVDVLANRETLFELKGASNSIQRLPNLLVLHFPADLVLLGALWRMPFSGRAMRSITYFGAAVAIALSVVQGYRHLVLLALLMWFFRRQHAVGPLVFALLLSGVGELSEGVKVLIRTAIATGNADAAGYFSYLFENLDSRTWLSREQMAIASNWDIFERSREWISVQNEFLTLIPGLGSILGITQASSGAAQIGIFAGVGEGQGTAFSHGVFLSLHPILACLVLLLLPSLASISRSSVLLPLTLAFTFSFLRDTPTHWLGQLKLLLLLLVLKSAISIKESPYSNSPKPLKFERN